MAGKLKTTSVPFKYKAKQSITNDRTEIVFNRKKHSNQWPANLKKISVPFKYKAKQSIPMIELKSSSPEKSTATNGRQT